MSIVYLRSRHDDRPTRTGIKKTKRPKHSRHDAPSGRSGALTCAGEHGQEEEEEEERNRHGRSTRMRLDLPLAGSSLVRNGEGSLDVERRVVCKGAVSVEPSEARLLSTEVAPTHHGSLTDFLLRFCPRTKHPSREPVSVRVPCTVTPLWARRQRLSLSGSQFLSQSQLRGKAITVSHQLVLRPKRAMGGVRTARRCWSALSCFVRAGNGSRCGRCVPDLASRRWGGGNGHCARARGCNVFCKRILSCASLSCRPIILYRANLSCNKVGLGRGKKKYFDFFYSFL
jgi:hypothetical protein